jgi:spermidine synthase
VVILFVKISPHPVPFALFTTGFTGASLEVVLVLGFQIIYGYVYSQVGVLLTAFMVGLVVGAFSMNQRRETHSFGSLIGIECGIIICSGTLALVLPSLTKLLFPVFMIVLGVLVGAEFSLASVLYYSDIPKTASALFSADLLGGCIGALLVSTLLIPFMGVLTTCGVVAGLNGVSLIFLLKIRR